jgi:hypothetical protein
MKKSKLEKVLEHMVNDEMDLANDLLHEHIVEAARDIYADLAEEDELVEDELDDIEDEVEAEEHFAEAEEDDDEDMDDLEGEMDMDMDMGDEMDMDMGDEMDTDGVEDEADVEDAMVNVEDALDELRAAFADMMGDDTDDEVDDEFDNDEFDNDEMDMDGEELEESATLKAHGNVAMTGDDDGKASPIAKKKSDMSDGHANPVKFADSAEETGSKGDSAKEMSVDGPQEQGGKFDNKVAQPSNSSEASTSAISGK